jgi:uncharacterized membrane protein YdbT with pleckstrin-like domain
MQDHYLRSLLGDHEEVIISTRQHWFVLFQSILLELFWCAIIIAAVLLVLALWAPWGYLGLLLLIIPGISLLVDVLTWTNRKFVVTNRRVMQIKGVFNKSTTDSSLEKVNDVKLVQSAFGRLFNFGDIEILTASELGANLFRKIDNPVHFKTSMLNAKVKLEDMGRVDEDKPLDIPATIAQLDKLRQQGILNDEEFTRKKNELLAKL